MKISQETKQEQHNKSGYLLQDIALLLFLAILFIGTFMVIFAPDGLRTEFIVMLLLTFLGIVFAAYQFSILAVITGGLQITIYIAYKLFFYFSQGAHIEAIEYIWLIYPLAAIGIMTLFVYRNMRMETLNKILRRQIDELVLVDSLTGLYNLKCLYLDLDTQVALATRRKSEITLMILSLRYAKELEKILGSRNFDTLKQQMALMVQDSLRIEDKLYAINEEGSLAVILTSNEEGAEKVKHRIKKVLADKDNMPEIIRNRVIKLDIQISFIEYNVERFGKDVMRYKAMVESELQYDV